MIDDAVLFSVLSLFYSVVQRYTYSEYLVLDNNWSADNINDKKFNLQLLTEV